VSQESFLRAAAARLRPGWPLVRPVADRWSDSVRAGVARASL